MDSRLGRLLEFFSKVGELKGLPRTGWVEAGIDEPESVADHCFRTSIIAMVLSDLQGHDTGRTIRIALLHDLAEIETGDLTPGQKRERGPSLMREEEGAVARLLSGLPVDLAERYMELWEELRAGASPEAEVVAHADKLEMVLQAMEYEEGGVSPGSLQRFWHADVGEGLPRELVGELMKKRRSGRVE